MHRYRLHCFQVYQLNVAIVCVNTVSASFTLEQADANQTQRYAANGYQTVYTEITTVYYAEASCGFSVTNGKISVYSKYLIMYYLRKIRKCVLSY